MDIASQAAGLSSLLQASSLRTQAFMEKELTDRAEAIQKRIVQLRDSL
jgi:hypothetical protein